MKLIERELIKTLKKLLGARVTYSRTGGGASSILLLKFSNCLSLWCWRYWEISQGDILWGTSEHDYTPRTGDMPKAAQLLENKTVTGFSLDLENEYQLWLCFDDDLDLIFFPEFERQKRFKSVINWELEDYPKNRSYVVTSELKLIKKNWEENQV